MTASLDAVAEVEKPVEDPADAGKVPADFGVVEQWARVILARRIADLGGAAAHQYDRPVPASLQKAQQHDRQQAADMQRIGRAIVADIGGHCAAAEACVERIEVGALMHEAALDGGRQKGGTRDRHGAPI